MCKGAWDTKPFQYKCQPLKANIIKAFSASNVTMAMSSEGQILAYSSIAITFLKLLEAEHPFRKPACARWIMDGRIGANCEAMILESNLESMLSKEMGRFYRVFVFFGY